MLSLSVLFLIMIHISLSFFFQRLFNYNITNRTHNRYNLFTISSFECTSYIQYSLIIKQNIRLYIQKRKLACIKFIHTIHINKHTSNVLYKKTHKQACITNIHLHVWT